jgi:hypothetical protein
VSEINLVAFNICVAFFADDVFNHVHNLNFHWAPLSKDIGYFPMHINLSEACASVKS